MKPCSPPSPYESVDVATIDESYYSETPFTRAIPTNTARLTPEQLLLVALILDALEQYQKKRDPAERHWLLSTGCYLLAYLPDRLRRRRRLIEVVAEIDAGKRFNFRLSGYRKGW